MSRKLMFFPVLFVMCLICCGSAFGQCTTNNGISFCTAEGCGTVVPKMGSGNVPTGAVVYPCTGYTIRDVRIDGSSEGAISTYDFPGGFINANHMIEVSFIKELQKRQSDNSPDQSENYQWYEGDCDKNSHTKSVECHDSEGKAVDENNCPSESKPSEDCPDSHTYSWYVGNWNACTNGTNGTQTRDVQCRDDDNKTVDGSYCTDIKPNSTQNCGIAQTISNLLNTDSGGGGCFINTLFGR